jgi:hypothetical protein
MLAQARYRWALSEYMKPLYIMTLGTPLAKWIVRQEVNGSKGVKGEQRVECLWVYDGEKMR